MAASILAQGTLESTSVVVYRAKAGGATVTTVRCVNESATPQTVVMRLAARGTSNEFARAYLEQHEAADFLEKDVELGDREAIVLETTTANAVAYHVHGSAR